MELPGKISLLFLLRIREEIRGGRIQGSWERFPCCFEISNNKDKGVGRSRSSQERLSYSFDKKQ